MSAFTLLPRDDRVRQIRAISVLITTSDLSCLILISSIEGERLGRGAVSSLIIIRLARRDRRLLLNYDLERGSYLVIGPCLNDNFYFSDRVEGASQVLTSGSCRRV